MNPESTMEKEQVLVSACCLGLHCRYHGRKSVTKVKIEWLQARYHLVPVCPEQLGGLPTPRPSVSWIDGRLQFKGNPRKGLWKLAQPPLLLPDDAGDAYSFFKHGAEEVLRIARCLNITKAYLLKGSPSCDPKQGVCALLLRENGIRVVTL